MAGIDEDEQQEEDCPKCPPAGAPAWMATFADMATLLMAFFVMILSFAEMNVPKFKQIQGSLKNSFGVQRLIPIVEQPMGTSIITQNFSPSPSPSITNNMTTETTQIEQPELKIPSDVKDSEGANEMSEGKEDEEGSVVRTKTAQATVMPWPQRKNPPKRLNKLVKLPALPYPP